MDNSVIADNFSMLAKLMDIHGENSFKTKTYAIAAFNIEKLPLPLKNTPRDQLFSVKGIGQSVGHKVVEMLDSGTLEILSDYINRTPAGVIEMLNIKGIGPKKINTIWKEMDIESIGELLYACNENRLTLFKGFGEKTQKNVQEAIEFYLQNQGNFLFSEINEVFPSIDGYLKKIFLPAKVSVTGKYRRHELTLDELEFIVLEENEKVKPAFQTAQPPELLEENETGLLYKLKNGLRLRLYTGIDNRAKKLFYTTGNPEFIAGFEKAFPSLSFEGRESEDDEIVFENAGIPFIPPFLRESDEIIEEAKNKKLPPLIQVEDVKAIIHSHSNWSDGANTIEEMAVECIRRKLEYLVISDHSKAAAYANGLSEERIREQHKYVDELNKKLAPFKIFKSIECDILNDGSMDYANNILATFDLVIASIHSNLKMNEEKAMSRLIRAIENPYTTILGHMTGRLLLSRNGYLVDHKKIIDACSANRVVIELNAHPRRLDMDWKWIRYAMEKNVLISIDPDAHYLDGFDDIKYGVLAAQKGGLVKESNLSSFSLNQFEEFLLNKQ
ncbi:MAG: DNA polymerase/3'-5' exonuclease PolX [Chitinophagaceae bacterium]|nr:DNA polymerase/3'-5' exonuclease PolX [Chitinophagaceae bacterium]